MKIYIIKSDHDSTPLAEVRTDGFAVEFTVDNTDGALPAQAGKSFEKLSRIVSSSSHLSMEEPKKATVSLLRYELSNGDIIEITTDARTCILNGRLLSDAEKRTVLKAIQMKEISVSKRADPTAPTPVLPSPPREEKKQETPTGLDREVISLLGKNRNDEDRELEKYNSLGDPTIDNLRMVGLDPLQEAHAKNMIYGMRHGAFKGEVPDAD